MISQELVFILLNILLVFLFKLYFTDHIEILNIIGLIIVDNECRSQPTCEHLPLTENGHLNQYVELTKLFRPWIY